jgi:hypothetical protein
MHGKKRWKEKITLGFAYSGKQSVFASGPLTDRFFRFYIKWYDLPRLANGDSILIEFTARFVLPKSPSRPIPRTPTILLSMVHPETLSLGGKNEWPTRKINWPS